MGERPDWLHQEEVRGIFVLGTIATIIALMERNWLDFPVTIVPASFLAEILLFFWGLYALIMAIEVSSDIFENRRFTQSARELGHALFVSGILFSSAILILGFVAWLKELSEVQLGAFGVTGLAGIATGSWLREKKNRAKLNARLRLFVVYL